VSRDDAEAWLHAIVTLDADPSARVECPACGMESLRFDDVPVSVAPPGARETARVLRCGFCGASSPA
jgi:hypothetical protein